MKKRTGLAAIHARKLKRAKQEQRDREYQQKLDAVVKKLVAEHKTKGHTPNLHVLKNTAKTLIGKGWA